VNLDKDRINQNIKYYKSVIENDNKDYESIYILSNFLFQNLQLEESIYYLKMCLEINPNYQRAKKDLINAKKEKKDLITYLEYNNPLIETSNLIIKCNQRLSKIRYDFNLGDQIYDNSVFSIINQIQNILNEEILDTEFDSSQIYREGKKKYYGCNRHFEVFNTFNVIPENCFGCFKINIEPRNVLELIKLYLIFDLISLKINLTKKCMVEIRKNINGRYKGLIYCVGLNQAKETLELLNPILDSSINKKIPRKIQRGCVEYSLSFPDYKEINPNSKKFMEYNPKWKNKEDIIDKKISKSKSDTLNRGYTLRGINLNDALVINNWLVYAKIIGDNSYKNGLEKPVNSKYMEGILNN
jgi:hypothetical protein